MTEATLIDDTPVTISLPPPFPGLNKHLLSGAQIPPIIRLETFSDKQFEIFILEWAYGYLSNKYVDVQRRGGSGDKGRDVIAWIDPPSTNQRKWDNYQCKHYQTALSPSDIWIEIGKLCYYTFQGDYTVPQNYFLVCNKGVGPSLADLLESPEKIKKGIIENWGKKCENEITKETAVVLEGELLNYVQGFDFSIVKQLSPVLLLDQHSKTKYHAMIFGSGLKPRPTPTSPPDNIDSVETRYVEQIYEAFSDHLKNPVNSQSDFEKIYYLLQCFKQARICFYSAESLKEFARDNLPEDDYFTELMEQILDGISATIYYPHKDGYERLHQTTEKVTSIIIDANILREELMVKDRIGICHQLANEDKITWVQKQQVK